MSIFSAALLIVFGLLGALCVLVNLIVAIVTVERVKALPEIVARLDNVETYLEELVEDVNSGLGMGIPSYEFEDGTPFPTDIQNIMNKMGTGDSVDQSDIDKLEAFFQDANKSFEKDEEGDDEDDEEEDKPWKKKK